MTKINIKAVLYAIGLLVAVAAVAFLVLAFDQARKADASVPGGNEYQATTTFAASVPAQRLLKTGYGALAQVTITGANTGLMTLYNATTSDVNKRTGNKATSTIVIADFPASVAAGTYTFDAVFTDGLLLLTSGTPATSTVTYR